MSVHQFIHRVHNNKQVKKKRLLFFFSRNDEQWISFSFVFCSFPDVKLNKEINPFKHYYFHAMAGCLFCKTHWVRAAKYYSASPWYSIVYCTPGGSIPSALRVLTPDWQCSYCWGGSKLKRWPILLILCLFVSHSKVSFNIKAPTVSLVFHYMTFLYLILCQGACLLQV